MFIQFLAQLGVSLVVCFATLGFLEYTKVGKKIIDYMLTH